MICGPDISILAESEGGGVFQLAFILLFAAVGIISSIVKKQAAKREVEKRQRAFQPLPKPEVQDGRWQPVDEPPVREDASVFLRPAMPVNTPSPVKSAWAEEKPQLEKQTMDQRVALHMGKAAPAPPPEVSKVHIRVDLNAKTARNAIIFHEIVSPPKALRDTQELWD